MSVKVGARLGPYEITGAIGAGGMGEVFRARDTKLNRDVAIKVLPAAFADDPERLARFTREAQTLASLNHPNIAAIYGIEEIASSGSSAGLVAMTEGASPGGRVITTVTGASRALVMELVEGQDLSTHMARGPIPLAEALPIARQIAEALEAAHEQGIVHRDLKPANIKVRSDGTVKVLDFGLAKAMDPAGASSSNPNVSHSPTLTHQGTMAGMIIGTAAYMSPEQAKGKPVDKRTDIWAFGVVLYEMLSGRRAFKGDDVSETLASVLKDAVNLNTLPADTPSRLRDLIQRCLARDIKLRLRDIGEARILLGNPIEPAAPVETNRVPSAPWPIMAAGALLVAGLAATGAWYARPIPSLPVLRIELPVPIAAADRGSDALVGGRRAAFSRDGAAIAYVDNGRLWVRRLDTIEPRDLGVVPADAHVLAWSPDSRSIAFAAEGSLRTLPAAGGPIFVVCAIPATGRLLGVVWQADGQLTFSVWRESLYSVPATGGHPVLRVAIDPQKEVDFHSLSIGPRDGLIFSTHLRQGGDYPFEILDGTKRSLLHSGREILDIAYAAPDYLVFRRREPNPGVWAARWSVGSLDPGSATLVAAGAVGFSVAEDGALLYKLQPRRPYAWVWVDRSGSITPTAGPPQRLTDRAALSPDGRRVAFTATRSTEYPDLFVRDLETGVDTTLTVRTALRATERYRNPAWFPSGDRLLYGANQGVGSERLVTQRADTAEAPREAGPGESGEISHDGRLLLRLADHQGLRQLTRSTLAQDGTVGEPQPVFVAAEQPDVSGYELSPDGRLLFCSVRESNGRISMRLVAFPDTRRQVVVDENGREPHFSRDGRALFYVKVVEDGRGQTTESLVSVPVVSADPFKLGPPVSIYTAKAGGPTLDEVGIAPDGRRFLLRLPAPFPPGEGEKLVYVQNWRASLKK